MDRLTAKERSEVAALVIAEAPDKFLSAGDALDWVQAVEAMARRLHRLYTAECNRPLAPAETRMIGHTEAELREAFAKRGLGLYLNGDPRGNPVGILTPKTGRYNTMGGAECGWRL